MSTRSPGKPCDLQAVRVAADVRRWALGLLLVVARALGTMLLLSLAQRYGRRSSDRCSPSSRQPSVVGTFPLAIVAYRRLYWDRLTVAQQSLVKERRRATKRPAE
jgi:hypothetical protein